MRKEERKGMDVDELENGRAIGRVATEYRRMCVEKVSWCQGVKVSRCHGVMVSRCHGVKVSLYHCQLASHCHCHCIIVKKMEK